MTNLLPVIVILRTHWFEVITNRDLQLRTSQEYQHHH